MKEGEDGEETLVLGHKREEFWKNNREKEKFMGQN